MAALRAGRAGTLVAARTMLAVAVQAGRAGAPRAAGLAAGELATTARAAAAPRAAAHPRAVADRRLAVGQAPAVVIAAVQARVLTSSDRAAGDTVAISADMQQSELMAHYL